MASYVYCYIICIRCNILSMLMHRQISMAAIASGGVKGGKW